MEKLTYQELLDNGAPIIPADYHFEVTAKYVDTLGTYVITSALRHIVTNDADYCTTREVARAHIRDRRRIVDLLVTDLALLVEQHTVATAPDWFTGVY